MKEILEYQKLDFDLRKLEKQINGSNEKNVMNQMINYVKTAQNKSLELEKSAKKLTEDYEMLKNEYDKNFKLIKELTSKKAEDLSEKQMEETFNKINLVSSNLYMIERNLNINVNNIKSILKEFENTKNQVIVARTKHKESKTKYDELVSTITPKIDQIKAEMRALESKIKPELLTRYKEKKHDNIFPVFVGLKDGNCGGCMMAQPKGRLDKLKQDGYIICEQCGRVIFNK